MSIQQATDLGNAGRLLLQEHLAGNCLDLDVGERHANGETVEELVQQRDIGERALTGTDDHHMAVELLGDRLSYLGDEGGADVGIPDVLLHFIKNQDGARDTPVLADAAQGFLGGEDERLRGDVGSLRRELGLDALTGLGLGRSKLGIALQNRASKRTAHVEIVELAREVFARCRNALLDAFIPPLGVEP